MSALTGGAVAYYEPLTAPSLLAMVAPVAAYWAIGLSDIRQTRHTVRPRRLGTVRVALTHFCCVFDALHTLGMQVRRNFPVLGNVRYVFETMCV